MTANSGSFTLPRSAVRDESLSIDSVGLLAWLATHSAKYVRSLNETRIMAAIRVGRDRLRRMLRELEAAGYLLRRRLHDRRGMTTGVRYEVRVDRQVSIDIDADDREPSMDQAPENRPAEHASDQGKRDVSAGGPAGLETRPACEQVEQGVFPVRRLDGFSGEPTTYLEDTRLEDTKYLSADADRDTQPLTVIDGGGSVPKPDYTQTAMFPHAVPDPEPDPEPRLPARRGHRVVQDWIDFCAEQNVKLPSRIVGHYARVIAEAERDGFDDMLIKRTLARMLADGVASRPHLLPNRLVAEQTGPERRRFASPAETRRDQLLEVARRIQEIEDAQDGVIEGEVA